MPRNWCFGIVVLGKILQSPLDSKQIKSVNPKGNQPWIFIGRLTLKMKLQNFDHLMQRANWLEKTLILGKIESRRRRGWERMRCLDGIINTMDMHLSKLKEILKTGKLVHGVTKSQTLLSNWTQTTLFPLKSIILSQSQNCITMQQTSKMYNLVKNLRYLGNQK